MPVAATERPSLKPPSRRQLASTMLEVIPMVNLHSRHLEDLSEQLAASQNRIAALEAKSQRPFWRALFGQ